MITGSSISISSNYILFLKKLQKKGNPVKRICPVEKTRSQIFKTPETWTKITVIRSFEWIISH